MDGGYGPIGRASADAYVLWLRAPSGSQTLEPAGRATSPRVARALQAGLSRVSLGVVDPVDPREMCDRHAPFQYDTFRFQGGWN